MSKQVAVILSILGNKTHGLLRNLCAPNKLSELSFAEIVVQKHLSSKPLVTAERFHFHKRNQLKGETISAYMAELIKEVVPSL